MTKNKFSKLIILAVVLLNILFTIATFYVFAKTGNEPVTLVGCWFGFTTCELWALASIKKAKVKNKGVDENDGNNGSI